MKARWLFVSATVAAIVAAVFHRQALGVAAELEGDFQRVRAETRTLTQKEAEDARRLAALRTEGEPPLQARAEHATPMLSTVDRSIDGQAEAAGLSSTPLPASESELRSMQVQAFVSEQRLRFGGLLKRLDFTVDQLQAFDRIQAACQQVMVDPTRTATERAQAAQSRDAALEDLFGGSFDRWREANRTEPAGAVVAQIVQHAFQGAGAFTPAQVEELSRLVGEHRLARADGDRKASPRYDWDAIIAGSAKILTETQREHVTTAIEFLRTSDEMAAIAAKKKS